MSIRKYPIAYLALFLALGGTAYAASSLPPGSVGTRQLKNGAVTGAKVHEHSLSANVFAPGAIPALKTVTVDGPANPPACPGSGCSPSPAGTSVVLEPAVCPSGYRVLGGGFNIADSGETVTASGPTSHGQGWDATVVLTQSEVFKGLDFVSAVCGSLG